jgi:phage minor structural protein
MRFVFVNAAGTPLFVREDAEQASWTHEEMSVNIAFPYDQEKVILRGMRVGFYDSVGDFQLFEIRKARTMEPDHSQEISAEHIVISELTDEIVPEKMKLTNKTASEALGGVLTGTLWAVGNVQTGIASSSADINRGDVWRAVRQIEENWNVYILPRVTFNSAGVSGRYLDIIKAEGTFRGVRLSLEKNTNEAGVIWDDTKLKTALYGYGKTQKKGSGDDEPPPLTFASEVWTATADHPAKPSGQTYIEDPDATSAFGRNGRPRFGYYQNGDIESASVLLEKTWETLKTVRVPDVEIDCTVSDLYRLGYADQPLRLHDTADIEIRPTNIHLQKEIIRMTEDLLDANRTRLTIGTYIPNIIYINRQNAKHGGGGGGSGDSQTDQEYQFQEYQTQITQNDEQIVLVAQHLSETVGVLEEAGIAVESQGVLIYQLDRTKGVGDVIRSIEVSVDGIFIQGDVISIKGNVINMGNYVLIDNLVANYATINSLNALSADFNNLTTGATTASMISTVLLEVGGRQYKNVPVSLGPISAGNFLGTANTSVSLNHSHSITCSVSGNRVTITIGQAQTSNGSDYFDIPTA